MKDVYLKAKEILGKKPIKKGEVIMSAEPFAYVIDAHQAGGYCENCLISSSVKNLKPCKLCGVVWYCSKNCEVVGCQLHNYECYALQRLNPYVPPSFARLLLRIINKLKDGGDQITETYGEFKSRKFKHLMNHYTDIRKDDTRMKDVRDIRKIMSSIMGEKDLPSESDFIGLYGRVLVNRFCLMDNRMAPIGSALYIKASIFDHSCEPNAYATFVGKNVEIRSLVDWPEFDYDKVFISYLDLLNGTPHRKMELWYSWYFCCQCPLCTNTERIQYENCIICENPDCKILVPVPEKSLPLFLQQSEPEPECPSCGTLVKREVLEEYQSTVAYTRQRLKTLKETSTSMDLCLNVLERQKNLLPPRNMWRVKALDSFFNAAYYNGIFSVALEWGRNNLEGMRYYYGPDHPTLGMFMMKLGKSLLYLKLFKEGNHLVEDAERILSIALGPRHDLVAVDIRGLKVMATEDPSILLDKFEADREQREHESVCIQCGKKNKPTHEQNGVISHNGNGTLITNGEISEETLKREFPLKKNPLKSMNHGLKINNQIPNGRKVMKTTTNKRTPKKLIRKRSKKVLDYSLLTGNSSDDEEEEEDLTEEEVNARIAKILAKYSSLDGQWIWEQSKTTSKNPVSNGYINDKKSKNSITQTRAKEEEVVYPSLKSTGSKKRINGDTDIMLENNYSKFNGDKSQENSKLSLEQSPTKGKKYAKNLMPNTNHISLYAVNDKESKLGMKVPALDKKMRETQETIKRESNAGTSKNEVAEETSKTALISGLPTKPSSQVPLDISSSNQNALGNPKVGNKLSLVNEEMERKNSKFDSQSSFTREPFANSALEYTPNDERITNKKFKPTYLTINDEKTNLSSNVFTKCELNTETRGIDQSTQSSHDERLKIKNNESLANGLGENWPERIHLKNKPASQNSDTVVVEVKHRTVGPKRLLDYSLIYGTSSDESDDSDSEVSMTEDEVYIRLSTILSKYSLPNGKMIWDEPKMIPPKVSSEKLMITSKVENKLKSNTSNTKEKFKTDTSSSHALKINSNDIPFKCSNDKSISDDKDEKILTIDSKSKKSNCKLDEKNPRTSYKSTLTTTEKTDVESTNVEVEEDLNGHKANCASDNKPEKPKLRMFDTTMGNRVIVRY